MGDAAEKPKEEEEIKLLFVGNEDKYLQTTFAFLEKRGWQYKFVMTMKEAFAEIATYRPSHVLVSWNLSSTNVPKAEKAITRGFKVPCIVFTEKELDPKKQHALAASGVKNYLIAPISGTSVHVKIRALIHEKLTAQDDPDLDKKMKAILIKGEGKNVIKDEKISIKIGLEDEIKSILAYMPKEAEWEEHGKHADGTPLWKLKKKGASAGEKHFFVFKGDKPPVLEDNKWKMPEGGGSFQQVEPGYKNNANRRVELKQMDMYDEDGVLIQDKFEMKTTLSKSVSAMGAAKKMLKPKSYKAQVKLQLADPAEQKKPMALYKKPPTNVLGKLKKDQTEFIKQQKAEEAASFAAAQKSAPEGSVKIEITPVEKGGGAKVNKAVIFKGARTDQNVKSAADQVSAGATKKTQHQMFADNKEDKPKIKNMMSQLQQQKAQIQKAQVVMPDQKGKQKVATGVKGGGIALKSKPKMQVGSGKTAKPTHKQFSGQKTDGKAKKFSKDKEKKAQLISQDKVQMKQGSRVKGALMAAKKKSDLVYVPKKNPAAAKKAAENVKVELKKGKAVLSVPTPAPKKQKLAKFTPRVEEKIEKPVKAEKVKIEKLPPKLKATSPLTAPRRPKEKLIQKIKKEKIKISNDKVKPQKDKVRLPKERLKPAAKKERPKKEKVAKVEQTKPEFHESKTRVFGKKKDSVLAAKVARAADNTASDHSKGGARLPLGMVTHVDCLPINSKTFSGLLIFATSAEAHCGPQFARQIKAEIYKLMSSSGEKIKDEGELELVVKPFNFIEVASEIADFVTITEHNGVELGTAFIHCSGVIPEFGEANAQNMIEVALEKIKPGEKLGYDAYIHMPLNQKYIRYAKKGGTIDETQLKNMTDNKVLQLYVRSDEVKTVKSHFASTFVEKVIQDFLNTLKKSA